MKDQISHIGYLRIGNPVKCRVSNDTGIYHVRAIDGINLKIMLDGARQGEWYDLDKIRGIAITEAILKKMPLLQKNVSDVYQCFIKINDNTFYDAIGFNSIPSSNYSEVYTDTNPSIKFKYWHDLVNFVACIDTHIDLQEETTVPQVE